MEPGQPWARRLQLSQPRPGGLSRPSSLGFVGHDIIQVRDVEGLHHLLATLLKSLVEGIADCFAHIILELHEALYCMIAWATSSLTALTTTSMAVAFTLATMA